jgi:hypothetical protein
LNEELIETKKKLEKAKSLSQNAGQLEKDIKKKEDAMDELARENLKHI